VGTIRLAFRCGLAIAALAACSPKVHPGTADGGAGDGAAGAADAFDGPYADFPVAPIIDPTGTPPPQDVGTLFGDPTAGAPTGGPCLVEPEVGTLYPRNWLRPRFSWVPGGSENLFELRITAANQVNPLVVYTTRTTWTMPADLWLALTAHTVDQPITVELRGATLSGATLASGPEHGSRGDIAIAPAEASGAIVYWTTSGGTELKGFHVGEETVHDIIRPADASTACVGCHASTPDGVYVGFSASPQAGNGDPATLGLLTADGTKQTPPFVTSVAQTLMARQGQEEPAFSKLHWQPGDHTAITMFQVAGRFEITWTDLEAATPDPGTGWGVIARTGDANPAAYASFAHTSDTLLYVSSSQVSSGVTVTHGDLATVPYGNRAGGTATVIAGAATTTYNEYYPTFSPDDKLVAFNRVADGQSSYNDAAAEVFVIPAAGGTPVRLVANDPPSCSGRTSPGVTNSWPKWAPAATEVGGKRYYWLTFSSTRGAAGNPQLYVTPVVDDGQNLVTYPALYLWNQPADENNHTPAWDDFGIVQ
jgi:hypothetical protein